MDQRVTLIDIATAIADGAPIDWHSVESDTADRTGRELVSALRLVEQIAFVHSNPSPPEVPTAGLPSEDLLTWGPLTIVEKIGSGTYGDVYRALDPRLDRPVALKLLRRSERDLSHPESAVIEEARLMARVRHPNVVTVHGAERIGDRVGIWMELIDGPTLETELSQKGPFAATVIIQLGLDLCGALEAVHRAGLLHGDVKASNIIRDANGRIVLGDFGAGHEFDPAQAGESASTDLTGTPLYLAPEILESGRTSIGSDIYSLGVVLYHLATGSFPVRGRTLRELRDAHGRNIRVPLSGLRRDLPRALVDLIERCIDPDSKRRFATVAGVQTRLQEVTGKRTAQRALRNRIAVAVALALTIGAFFALRRFAETPSPPSRAVTEQQIQPQGTTPAVRELELPPPREAANVADAPTPQSTGVTMRQVQEPQPQWTRAIGTLGPRLDSRTTTCIDRESFNLALCDLRTGDVTLVTTGGSAKPQRRVVEIAVGPDQRLAFVWSEEAPGKAPFGIQEVREIRRDGSGQRTVFKPEAGDRYVRLLEWIPARDALLVAVANTADVQRLGVVPLNGSAPTWVKEFEQVAPEILKVSADGRYVAFDMVPEPGNPARDIHVLDLDTRREWPLVEHPATDLTPIWAPDGRTLVFSSDRLGTMGVWKVATTNGHASSEPVLVRDLGRSIPTPREFTDGALLFGLAKGWHDVYTAAIDLERGTVGQPARISSRPLDQNMAADWSFNGDRIVYVTGAIMFGETPGSTHIAVKERSTNTERLLPHEGVINQTRLRWSPDARLILKNWSDVGTRLRKAAIVSAETGETIRELQLEPGTDGIEWSHGGDRIYSIAGNRIVSTSLISSLTTELHRVPPPDGINAFGGLALSPDDRWLAFGTQSLAEGGKRRCVIHIVPTNGDPPMERARFDQPCSGFAWSHDGRWLVFSVGANGTLFDQSSLWTVDTGAGEPRPLRLTMEGIVQIRLHPNGREILFAAGTPHSEVWLLEGFLKNNH